jgi:hypothetical protein
LWFYRQMTRTYRALQPHGAVSVSQPVGHVPQVELDGRLGWKGAVESKDMLKS